MAIGKQALATLRHRYNNKIEALTKKADHAAGVLIADAESAGTAFILGVDEGRNGPRKIGPVPLGLGLAVAGHIVGFSIGDAEGDNYEDHAHNVARGALCFEATKKGLYVGNAWREKALAEGDKKPAEQKAPGYMP